MILFWEEETEQLKLNLLGINQKLCTLAAFEGKKM